MYPIKVTLSLLVEVKSPSEAVKLIEPVLANVPEVMQFSLNVKGDGYFARNGMRKPIRSRKSQYATKEEF